MKQYFITTLLVMGMLSCTPFGSREKATHRADASATGPATDTIESFESFNERFHADSAFQVSRIAFPLKGMSVDGFEQHEWTPQNWRFLKQPVQERGAPAGYRHGYNRTDSTVREKFWIEDSGFKTERHFERKGGKWFLTYYDDINL